MPKYNFEKLPISQCRLFYGGGYHSYHSCYRITVKCSDFKLVITYGLKRVGDTRSDILVRVGRQRRLWRNVPLYEHSEYLSSALLYLLPAHHCYAGLLLTEIIDWRIICNKITKDCGV